MHGRLPEAVPLSLEGNGTGRLARGWLAVLACAITVALTFASLIGVGTGAASAATPGIETTVTLNGDIYNGTSVVNPGDTVTMKIQYKASAVTPGSTVKIELGSLATLQGVSKGNTGIKSIEVDPDDANAVLITFMDPMPTNIDQGVLDLNFKINQVELSEETHITWKVDGEEQFVNVIIKKPGDELANVTNGENKTVAGVSPGLNSYVTVADDVVTVSPNLVNAQIPYTLQIDRAAAQAEFVISDVLPESMTYVAGSFTVSQTTWDDKGLNKTTAPVVGFVPAITANTFTGTLALPGPSKTTISYLATFNESAAAVLQAELQTKYNAVNKDNGGEFKVDLKNIANLGGVLKEATTKIFSNVAAPGMPGVGAAFKKSTLWTPNTALSPADDGSLNPAQDVSFTLSTNMSQWKGSDKYDTLDTNVVISDALPQQLSWKSADANFLSSDQVTLIKAAPLPANLVAFQGDAYVNSYYIDETNQTLYVNVGKDTTRNIDVTALAQLNTVQGLEVSDSTVVPGQKDYKLRNRAIWNYTDWKLRTPGYNSDSNLQSQYKNDDGFNFPDHFKKSGPSNTVEIQPGDEGVYIDYTFTVGAGKGIDLTKSSIVDHVDQEVFDLSDLGAVKERIVATYDGKNLVPADFELELNEDGSLVFTLSAAGSVKVTGFGIDKAFRLVLPLPLKVVDGKETLQIKNKGTLLGEDGLVRYWSETYSEATSYGSEAEIRKSVRDTPNKEWSKGLKAEIDEDGNLVKNQFVFNVALVPHGDYDSVKILDVVDVLPESLTFLGFVNDEDVDTGANPTRTVKDLKGNIQAKFEAGPNEPKGGTVTMFQKPGTVLNAKAGIPSVNILVEVKDFTADEAIVNVVGNTSASITPIDGYPLNIRKVDSSNPENVIDDAAAHFQILDEGGLEVIVDNVFVANGVLSVYGAGGIVEPVKVRNIGKYTVKEIKAPKRYNYSDAAYPVTIDTYGATVEVEFPNTPVVDYAVGDVVWVDTNNNGLQDDGVDEVLEGVTVILLDGDGSELRRTETDAAGWYMFDELPAGDYQIKFELTDEQKKIYNFTRQDATDEDGNRQGGADSDANPADGLTRVFTLDETNTAVTTEYSYDFYASEGIDPTWDAGVVLKTYAVGDYVWVDADRDGLQGDAEVLEGVKVTLQDGEGNFVAETFTDANGRYIFDKLHAGEYQIHFDLTDDQKNLYNFTVQDATDDEGTLQDGSDSDVNAAGRTGKFILNDDNASLTKDYTDQEVLASEGIDPTWDAGVVLKTYAVGDFVWVDADRNGLQDDSEILAGVTVTLLDSEGNVVATTTTNEQGRYIFDNLNAGNYQIKFELTEEQKAIYTFTTQGGDAGLDSNADRGTGLSAPFTLNHENTRVTKEYDGQEFSASEGIDPTWDAGVVTKSYAVGDYVWVDANRDGKQGDSEVLKDVTVTLLDGEGNVVAATTTNEKGLYIFDELPAGEYQIKFELTDEQKEIYSFTTVNTGTSNADDSDADPASGLSATFTLNDMNTSLAHDYDGLEFTATEGIDPTWDAGVILSQVSVGDFVWVDTDRNGVQDPGEPGIKDVVLTLIGPDGKPVTDVFGKPVGPVRTDKDGQYIFEHLPVLKDGQSYTVRIDKKASEKALAPYIPTLTGQGVRGTDSSTWEATSEGLTTNEEHDPSLDFGFVVPRVSVGDYVWVDSNGDGRQDPGEPGIKDVVLVLTGPDGKTVTDVFGHPVGPVATDKDGKYTFENLPVLPAGQSYTVSIDRAGSATALAPYLPTLAGQGERGGDSSDWTASSGDLINDGDRDETLDFGFTLIPAPVDPVDPVDPGEPTATIPTTSAPATPADQDLSNTGFSGAVLMGMGLLLTLLGGGAVALTARRRRSSADAH